MRKIKGIVDLFNYLFIIVLGYAAYLGWKMLDEVAEFKGMCPNSSPDLPAYECTVADYVDRMIFGGWAMASHIFLLSILLIAGTAGWYLRRRMLIKIQRGINDIL